MALSTSTSEPQISEDGRRCRIHDGLAAIGELLDVNTRDLDMTLVNDVVTAAVRLFARTAEFQEGAELDGTRVSPSEALTLVSALLAAHDVNAFDLSMWLSRDS